MASNQESSEPVPVSTPRWKCVCAYDGGGFDGWQSQPGGGAVQDVIEARLAQMLGTPVRIHGSGRTDAGVHALAQVFHFDGPWRHGPDKLLSALRWGLPSALQIRSVRQVSPEFHARFSATGKTYRYHLHLGDADPFTRPHAWTFFRPLDFARMEALARQLCGRHDFRAFSAFNGTEREDTVRELRMLALRRHGRLVMITAEADGFLYKMVRSLVGALVSAGEGKLTSERVSRMLQGEERTQEVITAPAEGLFLARVHYGPGEGVGVESDE